MKRNKKAQQVSVIGLAFAALALVVLVIGSAFGIQITEDQRVDQACSNYTGSSYNSTANACDVDGTNGTCNGCRGGVSDEALAYADGITGVAKFPAKSSLIASILVMVFVIGLLLSLGRMGGR